MEDAITESEDRSSCIRAFSMPPVPKGTVVPVKGAYSLGMNGRPSMA